MRDIEKITDAIHLNAISKLEAHSSRVSEIKKQIADLSNYKTATNVVQISNGDVRFEGDIEFRWHRWVDSKIKDLNYALARELAERPRILADAKNSFGKKQATAKITRLKEIEEQKVMQRRQSYES